MRKWLLMWFVNYEWARRAIGGKWSWWELSLQMPNVWVEGWERPGCGMRCHAREDWSATELQAGDRDAAG